MLNAEVDTGKRKNRGRRASVSEIGNHMQLLSEAEHALRASVFFSPMSDSDILQLVTSVVKEQYSAGSVIVRQGESHNAMRVVVCGKCTALTEFGHQTLPAITKLLNAGVAFGTETLHCRDQIATVTAVEDSVILRVDYSSLQPIFDKKEGLLEEMLALEEASKKTSCGKRMRRCVGDWTGTSSVLRPASSTGIVNFLVNVMLRGPGQIMLMDSPVTGLAVGAAVAVSPDNGLWRAAMGLTGLLAASLLATCLLVKDDGQVRKGIYGYNGCLVGLALAEYFKADGLDIELLVFAAVSAMMAVMVQIAMHNVGEGFADGLPAFTLPANLLVAVFMAGANDFDHAEVDVAALSIVNATATNSSWGADLFVDGTLRSVSRIAFVDSWLSGAIILGGVAVCSRITAVAMAAGALLGNSTAQLLGGSAAAAQAAAGWWGVSTSLVAAYGGGMHMVLSPSSVLLTAIACMLCVALQLALLPWAREGNPMLTWPFCAAALVMVLLKPSLERIVPVATSSLSTPEQHLRFSRKSKLDLDEAISEEAEVLRP